tara:strand:+ start:8401 stop:10050 length:1650 start_codon:yes stop_codon:yes gene_type:complete
MNLLKLFAKEFSGNLWGFLLISALAGLSNAVILAIINIAADHASETSASLKYLLLFFITMSIYVLTQRHIMVTSTQQVERMIHRIRTSIVNKIQACDLTTIESVGDARIFSNITKETTTISQAAPMLVIAVQSGVLIFFTLLYIAWLSLAAFGLTIGFISIALVFHFKFLKKVSTAIHLATQDEMKLFDRVTDALSGFKESRMNQARNDDLYDDANKISKQASENKTIAQTNISYHFIISQSTFYLLLATMVFLLPNFSDTYSEVVIKTTTTVLFLIGPISSLVGAVPLFNAANIAINNVNMLEAELEKHVVKESADPRDHIAQELLDNFSQISFNNVSFSYPQQGDDQQFSIGPIDLKVSRGDIIFIAGGNGSGKSTFIKLLTGLYFPSSGSIKIDDTVIGHQNSQQYRNLMACVFTEYHLFKIAYGLRHVPAETVNSLIQYLELDDKVSLNADEFSTIELSAGQKKRIALLVSLMEDRPIYIFDEWAADQDPEFRRKFYKEILPNLKKQNKTVIAITHDDRYFDCADYLIRIDEGKVVSYMKENADA